MRPIDADALAQDFEARCLEGAALIRSAPTVEIKPDLYRITNRNGEKLSIEDTWDDLTYPELKQRIGVLFNDVPFLRALTALYWFYVTHVGRKATPWILTRDTLPPVGKPVVCKCKAGIYAVLAWNGKGWTTGADFCLSGFVIAWAPLPEEGDAE